MGEALTKSLGGFPSRTIRVSPLLRKELYDEQSLAFISDIGALVEPLTPVAGLWSAYSLNLSQGLYTLFYHYKSARVCVLV